MEVLQSSHSAFRCPESLNDLAESLRANLTLSPSAAIARITQRLLAAWDGKRDRPPSMRDDDWYTPKPSPPPPRQPKPRTPLWTLEKNGHTYRANCSSTIRAGAEAQILKDGELMFGRRFEEGWQTLQWAEEERKFIERGAE